MENACLGWLWISWQRLCLALSWMARAIALSWYPTSFSLHLYWHSPTSVQSTRSRLSWRKYIAGLRFIYFSLSSSREKERIAHCHVFSFGVVCLSLLTVGIERGGCFYTSCGVLRFALHHVFYLHLSSTYSFYYSPKSARKYGMNRASTDYRWYRYVGYFGTWAIAISAALELVLM